MIPILYFFFLFLSKVVVDVERALAKLDTVISLLSLLLLLVGSELAFGDADFTTRTILVAFTAEIVVAANGGAQAVVAISVDMQQADF